MEIYDLTPYDNTRQDTERVLRDLQVLREAHLGLLEQNSRLKAEVAELKAKADRFNQELPTIRIKRVADLQQSLEGYQATTAKLAHENIVQKRQIEELTSRVARLDDEKRGLEARIEQQPYAVIEGQQSRIQWLEARRLSLSQQVMNLEKEVAELKAKAVDTNSTRVSDERRREIADETLAQLTKQLEWSSERIENLTKSTAVLQRRNDALQLKADRLEQIEKLFASINAAPQNSVSANNPDPLQRFSSDPDRWSK